jgi:hypothetical protein
MALLALAGLVLMVACARTHIARQDWERMSANDKTLYVRTLLGHEKAKEAKGGNVRLFPERPDQYVKRIDTAYQRGDSRDVDTIFEEMGVKR